MARESDDADRPLMDLELEEKGQQQEQEPRMVQTTVAVEGMTCGACTSAIEGMSYPPPEGRRSEEER